jgi:hypothetical protein
LNHNDNNRTHLTTAVVPLCLSLYSILVMTAVMVPWTGYRLSCAITRNRPRDDHVEGTIGETGHALHMISIVHVGSNASAFSSLRYSLAYGS